MSPKVFPGLSVRVQWALEITCSKGESQHSDCLGAPKSTCARTCATPTKLRIGRGSRFLPPTAGMFPPALSFPTASSQGGPAELNFQLTELAHAPAGENSPIINTQNLSWSRGGVTSSCLNPSCKIDFSVSENTALLLLLLCALAVSVWR